MRRYMKKKTRQWISIMAVVFLVFINVGFVVPIPLEESVRSSAVEFQNRSILCDTGCGGYYVRDGQPVLNKGFDRTSGKNSVIFYSYPLVCVNCQKHTWYHMRLEVQPEKFQNGSILCDTGCGGYYVQNGLPVLACGLDRAHENKSTVFCSYPLICSNCQKHTWSHIQVDFLTKELVKEATELIQKSK